MAQPTGSSYSALILPKPSKAPTPKSSKAAINLRTPIAAQPLSLPKTPAKATTKAVTRAAKAVSSPKGLSEARANALFFAKPHPVAEGTKEVSSTKGLPKALKSKGGGNRLATILNIPAQIEAQGYKNLLGNKGVGGSIGKTLGDIAKEATEVGEAPFVAALKGGEALGALTTKGETKPGSDFLKGIAEGIEHGAAGELLQGHLGGAVTAAKEHPLFSATEAAGVESAAARPAGALLRGVGSQAEDIGVRGALARAGSTVRPPVGLTDEASLAKGGLVKERTYSKDPVRKSAQIAADLRREPITDAKGKVVTVKDRGRTVPVLKASEGEQVKLQKQRANFEASRTQGVEHLEREKARKTANEIEGRVLPPQRLGHELSQLVASGTIRSADSFKGDLEKRIRTIEDAIQHPERYRTEGTKAKPGELQAARHNLAQLRKAVNNPRVLKNAPRIVQNGLRYAEELNKGDRRLEGLDVHPAEELHRAALSEYALAHMNARHAEVDGEPALRNPKGELLTNEAIRRHAALSGRAPDSLAYVPHVIGAGRRSSFHRPFRPGGRPVFPGVTRTGALYRRGATAYGSDLVREELTKKGVTANNAEGIDKFVSESGLKRPDGQHFTAPEAMETARRLNADGTTQYVPVRAFAAKLDAETQEKLSKSQSSAAMETAHQAMLNDRIVSATDKSRVRNVVLVPQAQLQQLTDHLAPAGKVERAVQMLNGPFRMAVLPQPRWLTGNILEPYFVRLPLSGAGINLPGSAVDFAAATKAVNDMERSGDAKLVRAAQEVRGAQMGGMFVGRKGATVRRTYEDFSGKPAQALYASHVVRNLPVVKQMGDLVTAVPHTFFHLNRVIESTAQRIALGKSVRNDVQQITGSWTKTLTLGKEALKEVEKGMVNTPTQHRFMEEQYKLLGQYDGFNPTTRRLVQSLTPFIPWTLNALRFVYWTLPAHHSATFTALVKAAQHVQAEWEGEHGFLSPQQRKGTLADALVRGDKGLVDLGRYTPFGATIPFAHGDFSSIPSTILPQISGAGEALAGKDAFGNDLQVPKTASNPSGEPTGGQELGIAANQLAESMIPGVALGRRLQEKGGTSYGNSTIFSPKAKPETSHESAVSRTLNPFRPTYVKAKTKGGKGLGSGLGTGLGGGLGGGLK